METLPQDKLNLIQAWQESGLSKQEFCNQQNIGYHFFNYWEKKYRISSGSIAEKPPVKSSGFVKLKLPKENTSMVEIVFPNGIKVVLHQPDASFIKSLIA